MLQLDPTANGHRTTEQPLPTPSHEFYDTQVTTPVQTGRRRDYTKEEKEHFERWISSNPKPDRSLRLEYAKANNMTDSQLRNLINNRRRRGKSTDESKQSNQNTQSYDSSRQDSLAQDQDSTSPLRPRNECCGHADLLCGKLDAHPDNRFTMKRAKGSQRVASFKLWMRQQIRHKLIAKVLLLCPRRT